MKRISLKIIGVLISIAVIFQFNVAFAASTNTLKDEKASNNEEISNAQANLHEVQKEKSEAMNEVESLDSKIDSYESEISDLDSKISDLTSNIQTLEEEISQAESKYQEEDALLADRLVVMYEDGNTSYLDFLLSSNGLTDFLSKYYMVSELAQYDTDLLEQISNKKKEIEKEKTKLEENQTELATSKSQLASTQTQLEAAKSEKSKQVAQLSGEEKNIQAKIEQLKEDNKAIDAEIAAAQARIQAELKKQQSSKSSNSNNSSSAKTSASGDSSNDSDSGNSSSSSSGFIRPVSGYSVTTGWYYSSGALHGAVDFSGSGISGKPVLAVADGIVVTTQSLTTSYGNYIIIAHYNGLYTLYAHGQSGSIAVSSGQKVTQGQQIMRVGSTGNSTGPHLHFEVRTSPGKYANRVNPLNYLP